MKKFTFPMLLATALVAVSCSNEDLGSMFDEDSGKTLIEIGGAGNSTRAGFNDGTVATPDTRLMLHFVSNRKSYHETDFPFNDGNEGNLYMATYATAAEDATNTEASYSEVTYPDGNRRYWDDMHGKNSLLSIYGIAVPNKTALTNTSNKVYFDGTSSNVWSTMVKKGQTTEISHNVNWYVSTAQTAATIDDEDLTYTNNINSTPSDLRLKYDAANKVFEKATETQGKSLRFNHALSRITIKVQKGAGFDNYDPQFSITEAKLSGFYVAGTLNASTGTITRISTDIADVNILGTKVTNAEGDYKYTFQGQVFPGTTIKDVASPMLIFKVDGNDYYIKGNDIYTALTTYNSTVPNPAEEYGTIKAGKNYQLTVTIKKTGIETLSAKLVDWVDVIAASQTPTNAIDVALDMETEAGTETPVASKLYRSSVVSSTIPTEAANFATGYVGNSVDIHGTAGNQTTGWYWPNNTTFYHFRTISPASTTVTTTASVDQITMTGGAINDNVESGNDYVWGAPLKETHTSPETHTLTYSKTNGFETYLYPAIGATGSAIVVTQHHMMSNIQVSLSTVDTEDPAYVNLSGATVKLINHYNTAKLNLGNALISGLESKQTTAVEITRTANSTTSGTYTWRVIPQAVEDLKFEITADGNVYYVDIKDCLFNSATITDWLPGKAYQYSFLIKKKGIETLSAKLVNWVTVTGTIKDITLEN